MKKCMALLLAALVLVTAGACSATTVQQDDSPVTMLVTYGNGETYFTTLAERVKEDLGIDIEFVYETSTDPTDQLTQDFANDNLQADIVFTSAKVNDEYLKGSCIDLLSHSHITTYFTSAKVKECTADDGGVYQLPISSKLIGITYNATLLEEMGWELPQTFDDMLDLKQKCDEAGIRFSVSDFRETGHGFNYLFHIMGAQWLSGLEGADWLNGFLAGTETADAFQEVCEYFNRWVENDLFGSINLEAGWGATNEFARTRALFCFAILNNSTGYDGPMYDADGNETGVELHDVHKSMPWISENGDNNCFTYYDNVWMMVNNDLLAADQADKLDKVLQILEYMTGEEFAEMTSDLSADVYLALNNFEMADDRLYSDYADEIRAGFLQPWYYSYFDANTIVATGAEIGAYVLNTTLTAEEAAARGTECNYDYNPDASFDSVFEVLTNNNNNQVTAADNTLGTVTETLSIRDTARLTAIAGALTMQETLDTEGVNAVVGAALVPYVESREQLQPWRDIAVANAVLYPGTVTKATSYIAIPKQCGDVCAIRMTGAELQTICDAGYDPSGYFTDSETGECRFDKERYGTYPYVCQTRDGAALDAETEYIVAVSAKTLDADLYDTFAAEGRILTNQNGDILTANTFHGLELFYAEHPTVSADSITW